MLGTNHQGFIHPANERFLRTLSDLKTYGLLRLALNDRSAFPHLTGSENVGNSQFYEVATTELAVDGKIEKRQIAMISSDLKTNANRPNLFR